MRNTVELTLVALALALGGTAFGQHPNLDAPAKVCPKSKSDWAASAKNPFFEFSGTIGPKFSCSQSPIILKNATWYRQEISGLIPIPSSQCAPMQQCTVSLTRICDLQLVGKGGHIIWGGKPATVGGKGCAIVGKVTKHPVIDVAGHG